MGGYNRASEYEFKLRMLELKNRQIQLQKQSISQNQMKLNGLRDMRGQNRLAHGMSPRGQGQQHPHRGYAGRPRYNRNFASPGEFTQKIYNRPPNAMGYRRR